MDRNGSLRLWRYSRAEALGSHVEVGRVHVNEDRRCPDCNDGLGGGDEGVGGGNYFIARADLDGFERQGQGIGAVAYANRERCTAEGSELLLEIGHLRAVYELSAS